MHAEHKAVAIATAMQGSAVCIFALTLSQAKHFAGEVEAEVSPVLMKRISRRAGDFHIDFHGGGSMRFMSTLQAHGGGVRGMSLDRVYVPICTEQRILESIVPTMATSKEAVLTGY